ncbi:MAG: ABC transporter ATP-binding protein [Candidatus Thorarchaeota archaeon]|nr:ABC transporter ATP-binding protein [Candidatus Thorarchaeota archaeon]
MIRVVDVCKKFDEIVAVDDISLEIPKGTILGMIGPNGAGKTTLVRMMVGILRPTSGTCYVGSKPSYLLTPQERARMGYMTQQKALYPDLTARENLEFFAESYGILNSEKKSELIAHAADLTQIADSLDRPVEVLSGGTIQRLSLACAIVHDPDLIFLDEPTVGVSPDLRMEFWDHFHKLAHEGKTVVMTTHYLDEASRCDTVAMMFQGRILSCSPPNDIISSLPLERVISGVVGQDDATSLSKSLENVSPIELKDRRFAIRVANDAMFLKTFEAIAASRVAVSSIVVSQPGLEDAFAYLVRRSGQ